ncbi:MAG: VOC family protein [Actinomycetota bacterium]|nr:MAG: VOC family protein [Actinomycetota bacterium]
MSHTRSVEEHGKSAVKLSMLNIDSTDPARLAEFYAATLCWEVTNSGTNYGMVEGDGIKIGVGRIERFWPAQWPEEAGVKRFHLDLKVDDFDEAAEGQFVIGASQPDFQPETGCRVLLDRDGQAFRLSPRPAATP